MTDTSPVKRYTPKQIADAIMTDEVWQGTEWVRASDHDASIAALQEQCRQAEAKAAKHMTCLNSTEQRLGTYQRMKKQAQAELRIALAKLRAQQ